MPSALESFSPVSRKETLGSLVREQLRSAIMAGRFSPGEKLTIRAVATALDVSLTPAREALFNLVAEGALESTPNGRVYIPEMDERRIVEITKIRSSLEGLAAREAAARLDDDSIAAITAINDALIAADRRKDHESLRLLNWQFHFAIYRAAEMPQLTRMIEGCWLMIGSYLNVIYPKYGEIDAGIRNHLEIIRAMQARHPERLSAAVRTDIELASQCLLDMIRSQTEGGA